MRAITLRQPGAHALTAAYMNTLNRHWWWNPLAGQRIAVHAGQFDSRGREWIEDVCGIRFPSSLVTDAIVGAVTVKGAHLSSVCATGDPDRPHRCSRWAVTGAAGRRFYHWELTDPRECEPVRCRGGPMIWTMPPRLADKVLGRS